VWYLVFVCNQRSSSHHELLCSLSTLEIQVLARFSRLMAVFVTMVQTSSLHLMVKMTGRNGCLTSTIQSSLFSVPAW
jgi:hypothetical protein